MGDITTIRIHKEIKGELDGFKIHEREPYEDVLKRLMRKARDTDELVERERALASFVGRAKGKYGESVDKLILYGSHARGEAGEESDVDVLVVWNGDPSEGRMGMAEIATDVLLEHDVIISPKLVSAEGYEDMKRSEGPFIKNVLEEGVRLE
ncbi:MAG: nucleotidyltransferase domain-containing protein [Candidatus Hadarchaeota archaeon]